MLSFEKIYALNYIKGVRGIYSLAKVSGTMAAGLAAGSEIFQFRWTDTTSVALIRSVRILAGTQGTGFAAGVASCDMFRATAWTVAGTGGATATITGDNLKRHNKMLSSLVNEIRIASTAALGVGTKTLLDEANHNILKSVGTGAGAVIWEEAPFIAVESADDITPIILEANEGFVLKATVPATGTWSFSVSTYWDECTLRV